MRKPKVSTLRRLTMASVLLLACVGFVTTLGIGTPSSFGADKAFLLCPLGALESLLASKLLIPQVLISLAMVVAVALLAGRSWCAWGCPAHAVRGLVGKKEPHASQTPCAASVGKTVLRDSRIWVLGAVLAVTLVVGFPVFCLVCPVGLTFATIASIWSALLHNEISWGLVLFPAALVLELVAMKTWCMNICPLAGLLSLCGRIAPLWRPQINGASCLQSSGKECNSCKNACPAGIDLHADDVDAQLADCTRCGGCTQSCPSHAVSMPTKRTHSAEDS